MVIIETRCSRRYATEIVDELPFNAFETVDSVGLFGGILLLWNGGVCSFTPTVRETCAIHGVIQVNSKTPFFVSSIYGSTKHKGRVEMWRNLEFVAASVNMPWICLGDFNEICHASEKWGNKTLKEHRMNLFKDTMRNCNLVDLDSFGNKFTWVNKRRAYPIYEKLDRIWENPDWITLYPNANVENLSRMSSDHNHVLLRFDHTTYVK